MTDYIVGDLHGYHDRYRQLLLEAGLISEDNHWTGGDSRLVLVGDYFDRGRFGVDCVELTMALQREAPAHGGEVIALLGNHDMMILCAWKHRNDESRDAMRIFDQWITWGGVESDLKRLTAEQAEWIAHLPAMVRLDDMLIVHADAMLYVDFGTTVEAVNENFATLLAGDDLPAWERTLRMFAEHRAFSALGLTGHKRAEQVLRLFGGNTLVHGHTPIPLATGAHPESVTAPLIYARERCINVDAGLYMGSPGFLFEVGKKELARRYGLS